MSNDEPVQLPRLRPLPPMPLQDRILCNPGGDDRVQEAYIRSLDSTARFDEPPPKLEVIAIDDLESEEL